MSHSETVAGVGIRTRYLYLQHEVFAALLVALLHGDQPSATFWAFELLFSGVREPLGRFFQRLYASLYRRADDDDDDGGGGPSVVADARLQRAVSILSTTVARGCPRCARAVHLTVHLLVELRPTAAVAAAVAAPAAPPAPPTAAETAAVIESHLTRRARWNVLRTVTRDIGEYAETGLLVPHRPTPPLTGPTWLNATRTSPVWAHRRRLHRQLATDDDAEAFHDAFDYEIDEQPTAVRARLQLPSLPPSPHNRDGDGDGDGRRTTWSPELRRAAARVLPRPTAPK